MPVNRWSTSIKGMMASSPSAKVAPCVKQIELLIAMNSLMAQLYRDIKGMELSSWCLDHD